MWVTNNKSMTPEKFQLLRDWVRAEIRSVIIEENKGSTATYWSETRDEKDAVRESDKAFLRTVQAFCGGQVIL